MIKTINLLPWRKQKMRQQNLKYGAQLIISLSLTSFLLLFYYHHLEMIRYSQEIRLQQLSHVHEL